MMPFFIIFISLFSTGLAAQVDFTTKKPSTKEFTLKKSCEEMGHKHVLLATAVNQSTVDCMGSKLNATKFCKTKFNDDPRLLRGFVNTQEKILVCHFADSAILTVPCKSFKKLCVQPKTECSELKGRYAHSLELIHSSISSRKEGEFLRCYYSTANPIDKKLL